MRALTAFWFPLLCLGLSLPAPAHAECVGKTGQAGAFELTFESGGFTRNYRLYVPTSYKATAETPLWLNFHGLSDSASNFERGTGMKEKAEKEGFISIHPDGFGSSWNAGWCCAPASTVNVDDVQLARDLVAATAEAYCVDPKRVYASGFSNGAFLSHRLGCEAADLFASIAPASGEIAVSECNPSEPISVIQTHGKQDVVVPYRFGLESSKGWARNSGCSAETTSIYQKGTATCYIYNGCAPATDVEFCSVQRMGHDWPTWDSTNGSIDATDFFWDFLKAHPKP